MTTASYRGCCQADGGLVTTDLIAAAGRQCHFSVADWSESYVVMEAGASMLSWGGEGITVRISRLGDGQLIEAESRCLSFTLGDFGKNEANVRRLFEALEEWEPRAHLRPVPVCGKCGYLLAGIARDTCPECGAVVADRDLPRTRLPWWLVAKLWLGLGLALWVAISALHLLDALPGSPDWTGIALCFWLGGGVTSLFCLLLSWVVCGRGCHA